ncbi:MAG TPA: acyl-CoA dehydrogenase family protein [Acidimicrobiales bacterium]|nr:acyl-CoA dehydrogenase family protein [Acidimicrobiales bacterium]
MHFGPTSAQEALRGRVRSLFEELSPSTEVRRLMETDAGFDRPAWRRLAAAEGGLQGIHLPAAVGGGGQGWAELGVVLEEAGRVLFGAPLLSTALAAAVLLASFDDEAVAETLASVAAGGTVATLAVAEAPGRWDASGVAARAVRSPDGRWRLEGEKSYVVDGGTADVVVVAARHDTGVGLFLVEGGAPGLSRSPLATVDMTRKQATLTLAAVPARLVRGPLPWALQLAAVGLAAEQVGGAAACLDRAVAYAKRRVQFGRPIGSFQAVKHLCAEMLLDLESARSAASYAASVADRVDGDELAAAAAVAKSCCSDAYVRIAADSLHVHGGVGFTWDDDAHLYFRRARSSALLFGDANHHRELLAHALGV